MQSTISIKLHHFVDIITSFGTGNRIFKPHPYGHAVHIVSEKIDNNQEVYLKIELGIDDICRPCAHNVAGFCDDTIDTSYRPSAPSSKEEKTEFDLAAGCRDDCMACVAPANLPRPAPPPPPSGSCLRAEV